MQDGGFSILPGAVDGELLSFLHHLHHRCQFGAIVHQIMQVRIADTGDVEFFIHCGKYTKLSVDIPSCQKVVKIDSPRTIGADNSILLSKTAMNFTFQPTVLLYSTFFLTGLLACGLTNCHSAEKQNNKLIVVHARGLSHSGLMDYLDRPGQTGSGFFKKAQASGDLHPLRPITNAVTICNIASFETGTLPAEHGIVGHTFGSTKNNFEAPISGFSQKMERETYWEKADKAGLKVLNVGALILHGKYDKHQQVDCLAQGSHQQAGKKIKLIPNTPGRSSTAVPFIALSQKDQGDEGQILLNDSTSVFVYANKDTDPNTLIFDTDSDDTNGNLGTLLKGGWLEGPNGNCSEFAQSTSRKVDFQQCRHGPTIHSLLFHKPGVPFLFCTGNRRRSRPLKRLARHPLFFQWADHRANPDRGDRHRDGFRNGRFPICQW